MSGFSCTLTKKMINSAGDVLWSGSTAGDTATSKTYTSAFTVPGLALKGSRYVSVLCYATAVSGTNLDVSLEASLTEAGSKFLMKDAVVADMTTGSAVASGGVVDLAIYPAPYYYIGVINDSSEAANTLTVSVFVPAI